MEISPNTDLGGLNLNPSSGASSNTPSSDISPSAQIIRERKQRSDAGKPRGQRQSTNAQGLSGISQTQFAQLYDPEVWGKVLSSPADAAQAITGSKLWELSESERKTLGATGSIAAQSFAVSDPRYLALSLAIIAVIDIYGIRIAKQISDNKAKEKAKKDSGVS